MQKKKNPRARKALRKKIRFTLNSRSGRLALLVTEVGALILINLSILLLLLGSTALLFEGTELIRHLLPFLISVFGISLGLAICLVIWWKFRRKLIKHWVLLPSLLAAAIAIGTVLFMRQECYYLAISQLRTMIGGKSEANRATVAHQVYATYRRHNGTQLLKLVKRATPYKEDIIAAATAFSLDPDLLFGLAAAESSFYPRKSKDGGVGLFQLTNVPQKIEKQVASLLKKQHLNADNHKYNTFVAAATLKNYLSQMQGDHLLGLLAYNIGPANNGLKFIMEQYKASDFTSIQPYLQPGPRNYPIRVLSYALAFRIWHQKGKILTYEEGSNAIRIQMIAIPGLDYSK